MWEQLLGIFENLPLWCAILAWAAAQLIKIIIEFCKTKKLNPALLVGTGGMPSSHTAFVTAMSITIGLSDGFGSPMFAISAVLMLIVMSDAAGVRRAAGKQAEVINMIVENIENTGIKLDKKLKELLGHSPIEVAVGAVLGTLIAVICHG